MFSKHHRKKQASVSLPFVQIYFISKWKYYKKVLIHVNLQVSLRQEKQRAKTLNKIYYFKFVKTPTVRNREFHLFYIDSTVRRVLSV